MALEIFLKQFNQLDFKPQEKLYTKFWLYSTLPVIQIKRLLYNFIIYSGIGGDILMIYKTH